MEKYKATVQKQSQNKLQRGMMSLNYLMIFIHC